MDIQRDSDNESNESNDDIHVLDDESDRQADVATYSEIIAEEVPLPTENTFDLSLPSTHSYLGQNLEELRGRTILDDGIYMNLPLLVKKSVILFPGQTLPLTVFGPDITMLETCIQNNRTFGVVCLGEEITVPIGTTAEIYEYSDSSPTDGFRLKAKGRQRFKIIQVGIEGYDKLSANVKILPEITLGPPLLEERISSLDRLRFEPTNEGEARKQEKIEQMDASVTPWPAWVYRQYDPMRLSLKIRQQLEFIEKRGSNIPKNPTDLSFWVAQNLMLDDDERVNILNYDCAISRLQHEIRYINQSQNTLFICYNCDSVIAKQSDLFPMSREGPQSAYCNYGGVIHETITLYQAQGLILSNDPPSVEFTWFPGYAWTIATCKNCGIHMGWKYNAVENNLRPETFWGLTRKSLKNKPRYKDKSNIRINSAYFSDSEDDLFSGNVLV